jgi:DNA sulfur modification protein DndC
MELVINFSGGKDSSAMLAFLCEKYPHITKHVVYADTGWEHEGTEEWCKSIVEKFGLTLHVVRNPNKTFLTMVENRKKFPGMQQRQCTSDLKRGPVETWIRRNVKDPVIINCLGMRSEESAGRAKQKKLKRNRSSNSKRTIWDWLPIKDWKEHQVYDFLSERNIPLHKVYNYLRRFSCRVCIFMTEHDLNQVQKNDPEAVDIIDLLENKIDFTMFQKGNIKSIVH